MPGRRHGGLASGSANRHRKHNRRSKSTHASSHARRAHGRRTKRPSAGHRYHLRRRYLLHGGALGAEGGAAAGSSGLYGLGSSMFDEGEESEMLQMRFRDTDSEEEEDEDEEEIDDDDAGSDDDGKKPGGPPALENEDQVHVFFFYVGGGTEVDIVEHYIGELEAVPGELKCLSNERDFKADLTAMQNVVLAFGLSQRTVVLCTQEFVDNEYEAFIAAANLVMTDEEKRLKIYVLLPQDVDLPKGLHKNRVFALSDDDGLSSLTKLLCSGAVPKELYKTEPTAPPLDTVAEDAVGDSPPAAVEAPKEPPLYQNGTVVKRVTADNYKEFEFFGDEDSYRACRRCFGDCDAFCPLPEPQYEVPQQLRKRGLLVQQEEFQEILQALSDASRIKFFHKAVDCSLPCLYLCIILVAVALLAPIWFLSVGVVKHHRPQEDYSSAIFWSFLLCVIIVPALVALAALLLLMHLANAKYAKFRGKIEEFNKRFRETNLVLHGRKGYWYCSGRLKLFFIYYDFEECQQNLYYQVYEHMKYTGNGSTCNSSTTGHTMVGSDLNGNGHVTNGPGTDAFSQGDFEQDIPTLKMDRILKRVNTLKRKYEWDYFEELTTKKLPDVEERQHRKSGMCFCQYALRRNMHDDPISWAEMLKERCESTLKNAFRKSHVRRQLRKSTNLQQQPNGGSALIGSNGAVRHSKPDIVYI